MSQWNICALFWTSNVLSSFAFKISLPQSRKNQSLYWQLFSYGGAQLRYCDRACTIFIRLWNMWFFIFYVNDLYIYYNLLLWGGTWDTRGPLGFQFLWPWIWFLLWLCISLGPFWKFGNECVYFGPFSKRIAPYMENSYYMECRAEIWWKWVPNFWNNYYETCYICSSKFTHYNFVPYGETADTKGLLF